jgi:phosphoserine phosphatase
MLESLDRKAWNPGVLEELERFLAATGGRSPAGPDAGPLAVFDLDHTCLRGDIGYAFFHHMTEHLLFRHRFEPFRRSLVRFDARGWASKVLAGLDRPAPSGRERQETILAVGDMYRAVRKELGSGESFAWMAGLLLGWSHDEVRRAVAELLSRELSAPLGERVIAVAGDRRWAVPAGIRVYEEMKKLISILRRAGFDVWIVSATSQPIVEAAAERLDVPADRCIGVRFETSGGVLSALSDQVTYRTGKVEAIRRFIGKRPRFAAGDWFTDLEMLDDCDGMRLLLDRGNMDLVEYGKDHGWTIQPAFQV